MRHFKTASVVLAGVAAATLAATPAAAIPPSGGGSGDPPPPDCVALTTGSMSVSQPRFFITDLIDVSWTTTQQAGCNVYKSVVDPNGVTFPVYPEQPVGALATTQHNTFPALPKKVGVDVWTLEVTGNAGITYIVAQTSAIGV
jgi:hypothetical protein